MMKPQSRVVATAALLVLVAAAPGATQETAPVPCKDIPCSVYVDWTRSGGVGALQPDRRYGNPAQLEELIKADLTSRGFSLHGSASSSDLRIVLVPALRSAICDQMAGTATDRSCRAVVEIEARVEGPDPMRERIELPATLRNRCGSDQLMPAHRLATYVAQYITYGLEGRHRGDRRPVGRC